MDKKIRLLTADEIECRVQSVQKAKSGKVWATLLIYKDARVDMKVLDEVYGTNNWQRTHEIINGRLFCNIDIWDADKKCWVRKQDVGTESNTEPEKGQASDAFKRAGFNVGIGRELYTAPHIRIELSDSEYSVTTRNGKESYKCWTAFTVSTIGYNDKDEIIGLQIIDGDGKVRYSTGTAPRNTPPVERPAPSIKPMVAPPTESPKPEQSKTAAKCSKCGAPITAAEQAFSERRYGKRLCRICQKGV